LFEVIGKRSEDDLQKIISGYVGGGAAAELQRCNCPE
jgi:hypothetical protein